MLASRLRYAMSLRQSTIHGLARASGYAINTVTLYRRQYGHYRYQLQIVADFAQALNVRAAWLAFGEGDME